MLIVFFEVKYKMDENNPKKIKGIEGLEDPRKLIINNPRNATLKLG